LEYGAINPVAISDYPSGGTEVFVGLSDNSLPPVVWSVVNDEVDGLSTTVNAQGDFNGKITITY
jgi:hypothetical protein